MGYAVIKHWNPRNSEVVTMHFPGAPGADHRMDSAPGRKKSTSHKDRFSPLLCRKLRPLDHSRMGGFIDSSLFERFNRNDKQSSRRLSSTNSPTFLVETLRRMEEVDNGLVCDLVVNLGEAAASEWENRKRKRVVVPASLRGRTIPTESIRI
jgi:hypothetical protein